MSDTPVWSENLRVGNKQIDTHHQKLIALCHEAAVAASTVTRDGRDQFHSLLNELATLVTVHFQHEEALLERNQCPNLEPHKAAHISYQERLADLLFDGSRGLLDGEALHRVAKDYLIKHMLEMDLADSQFLVEASQ